MKYMTDPESPLQQSRSLKGEGYIIEYTHMHSSRGQTSRGVPLAAHIPTLFKYISNGDMSSLKALFLRRPAKQRKLFANAESGHGWTPLMEAIHQQIIADRQGLSRDYYPLIAYLLMQGAAPNQPLLHSQHNQGLYPLQYAVLWGRVNIVRLLVEKGADPNQVNPNKALVEGHFPALLIAAQAGFLDIVIYLCGYKDINLNGLYTNSTGMQFTCLSAAMKGGHREVIDYLLGLRHPDGHMKIQLSPPITNKPLYYAACPLTQALIEIKDKDKRLAVISQLLTAGIDVLYPIINKDADESVNGFIQILFDGDADLLQLLMKAAQSESTTGFSFNRPFTKYSTKPYEENVLPVNGYYAMTLTPLSFLAADKKLLLQLTAVLQALGSKCRTDITVNDSYRQATPLLSAAVQNNVEALALLMAHRRQYEVNQGIDLLADGFTLACAQGHIAMVAWFLEQGVDVNALDGAGVSALAAATMHHQYEMIALLISRGANVDKVYEHEGQHYHVLALAVYHQDVEAIRQLLPHSQQPFAFFNGHINRRNSLVLAVLTAPLACVELLLTRAQQDYPDDISKSYTDEDAVYTLLTYALTENPDPAVANYLLAMMAPPEVDPLLLAAANPNPDVFKYFLQQKQHAPELLQQAWHLLVLKNQHTHASLLLPFISQGIIDIHAPISQATRIVYSTYPQRVAADVGMQIQQVIECMVGMDLALVLFDENVILEHATDILHYQTGLTAMHIACIQSDDVLLDVLLRIPTNANSPVSEASLFSGVTPLMLAMLNPNPRVLSRLLKEPGLEVPTAFVVGSCTPISISFMTYFAQCLPRHPGMVAPFIAYATAHQEFKQFMLAELSAMLQIRTGMDAQLTQSLRTIQAQLTPPQSTQPIHVGRRKTGASRYKTVSVGATDGSLTGIGKAQSERFFAPTQTHTTRDNRYSSSSSSTTSYPSTSYDVSSSGAGSALARFGLYQQSSSADPVAITATQQAVASSIELPNITLPDQTRPGSHISIHRRFIQDYVTQMSRQYQLYQDNHSSEDSQSLLKHDMCYLLLRLLECVFKVCHLENQPGAAKIAMKLRVVLRHDIHQATEATLAQLFKLMTDHLSMLAAEHSDIPAVMHAISQAPVYATITQRPSAIPDVDALKIQIDNDIAVIDTMLSYVSPRYAMLQQDLIRAIKFKLCACGALIAKLPHESSLKQEPGLQKIRRIGNQIAHEVEDESIIYIAHTQETFRSEIDASVLIQLRNDPVFQAVSARLSAMHLRMV